MRAGHRDPVRAARAGDEALLDASALKPRFADRVQVRVRPVDASRGERLRPRHQISAAASAVITRMRPRIRI
jgi:hypothetical protein